MNRELQERNIADIFSNLDDAIHNRTLTIGILKNMLKFAKEMNPTVFNNYINLKKGSNNYFMQILNNKDYNMAYVFNKYNTSKNEHLIYLYKHMSKYHIYLNSPVREVREDQINDTKIIKKIICNIITERRFSDKTLYIFFSKYWLYVDTVAFFLSFDKFLDIPNIVYQKFKTDTNTEDTLINIMLKSFCEMTHHVNGTEKIIYIMQKINENNIIIEKTFLINILIFYLKSITLTYSDLNNINKIYLANENTLDHNVTVIYTFFNNFSINVEPILIENGLLDKLEKVDTLHWKFRIIWNIIRSKHKLVEYISEQIPFPIMEILSREINYNIIDYN